jgi:dATP/dGTP diphosphohydrolase
MELWTEVPNQSAQPCGCDPGAKWTCVQHALPIAPVKTAKAHFADTMNALLEEDRVEPVKVRVYTPKSSPASAPTRASTLPTDGATRKQYPIATGVLDYFPDALAAIAHVSYVGNDQHNAGQPLHWAREKSMDESDTMIRHFLERGSKDIDGLRHTAKMAWRALAILQKEIEGESR